MSEALPASTVKKLDEAGEKRVAELERQVRVMNRALNQIQRGLLAGENEWHREIARSALIEACGEIWT